MRNIINISLPEETAKMVKNAVRKGNFATTSEFFRHLLRLWNNEVLAIELNKDLANIKSGKLKLRELQSIDDLDSL